MKNIQTILSQNIRQHGQAMTEFVIGVLLFLLPIFLIIPMLGKYADVKDSAAQTARYVAWERTVWFGGNASSNSWPANYKSEGEIENEARQRIVSFGHILKSNDKNATAYTTAGARELWKNRNGEVMLQKYDDAATGNIANDNSPDIATGTVLNAIVAITAITGFNLETKGYYTGNAAITVNTLPIGLNLDGSNTGKFDPGVLVFRDKNVILANGWSANGSGHVKTQTAGLAPLGLVNDSSLKPVVQALGCALLGAFTPEFCFLEIGKIAPDVVPPDRLTP